VWLNSARKRRHDSEDVEEEGKEESTLNFHKERKLATQKWLIMRIKMRSNEGGGERKTFCDAGLQ
jgi:hypothetical protein